MLSLESIGWTCFAAPAAVAALALVLAVALRSRLFALVGAREISRGRELAVVAGAVLIGAAFVYGNFALGLYHFGYNSCNGYVDLGSDTATQYIPFYLELIHSVRAGEFSLWSFNWGLGSSLLVSQEWLFDPFNLVLVPLCVALGDAALPGVLVLVQCLKVLLCALVFDRLLVFYCTRPAARIMGALVFAFSGFLMLWGQHYWMGDAMLFCALVIWAMECVIARVSAKRLVALGLAVAAMLLWSAYLGYMAMLFATVYFLLRLAAKLPGGQGKVPKPAADAAGGTDAPAPDSAPASVPASAPVPAWRRYLRTAVPAAIAVAAGCLISCIVLVPVVHSLFFETFRLSSGGSMLQRALAVLGSFPALRDIFISVTRFMGSNLCFTGTDNQAGSTNFYETVQIGCSAFVFVFAALFVRHIYAGGPSAAKPSTAEPTPAEPTPAEPTPAKPSAAKPLATKIAVGIAIAFCILYICTDFVPSLIYFFSGIIYRSSFTIVLLVSAMIAYTLDRVVLPRRTDAPALALGSAFTLIVLALCVAKVCVSKLSILLCLFFALCVAAGAVLLYRASCTTAKRPSKHPERGITLLLLLILATSWADAFVSTNFRCCLTDETFPVSSLSGGHEDTEAALEAVEAADDGLYRTEKLYADWVPNEDSWCQDYDAVTSYNATYQAGIDAFFWAVWPKSYYWAHQSYASDPDHETLLDFLGVKYVLSKDGAESPGAGFRLVGETGDVDVYENVDDCTFARLWTRCVARGDFDALGTAETKEPVLEAAVVVPDETAQALASRGAADVVNATDASAEGAAKAAAEAAADGADGTVAAETVAAADGADASGVAANADAGSFDLQRVADDHLAGTIRASRSCVATVAVPRDAGWTVYVDGAAVEHFAANLGFIGFAVDAGDHTVELRYEPYGWQLGACLTVLGAVLLVVIAVRARRKRR